MAVYCEHNTIIIRRDLLAARQALAGRLDELFPYAWRDDHLWAVSTLTPPHEAFRSLEELGLERIAAGPPRQWSELVWIDCAREEQGLPCPWLAYDQATRAAWLAGTDPGAVVGPGGATAPASVHALSAPRTTLRLALASPDAPLFFFYEKLRSVGGDKWTERTDPRALATSRAFKACTIEGTYRPTGTCQRV